MSLILNLIQSKLDSSGFDWAKLHSLHLSPSKKTLTAEVKLAGEAENVRVEAIYRITDDNQIVIEKIETSRQWMTEVAELAMAKTGASFPLPGGIKGKMIKLLL